MTLERVVEPELMIDEEQARQYSEADFSEPHQAAVDAFRAHFPEFDAGRVLDVACGPADVTTRLAVALPQVTFVGVDGSEPMLALGRERVARMGLAGRIELEQRLLPDPTIAALGPFDAVVCTSALHHFHDPMALWHAVRDASRAGTCVLVKDLMRPGSIEAVDRLVELHTVGEPEQLRTDYRNSLRAAFTIAEVHAQLAAARLDGFAVDAVSDRHLLVTGTVRPG